jgi:DNA-binding winged helix-turn-helix (wHTH) protein/TolB-like protein
VALAPSNLGNGPPHGPAETIDSRVPLASAKSRHFYKLSARNLRTGRTETMPMAAGVATLHDEPVRKEGPVLATARHFRFGSFEFHSSPARLVEEGESIKVRPQALQVLELLLSRAGETVSREEIRRHLWGNEEYLDHERGINSALLHLRKALRDEPQSPSFVETVPRQGYRFIAPVELSETPLVSRAAPEPPIGEGKRIPWFRIAVLAALLLVVAGISVLWGRLAPGAPDSLPRVMIYPMQDAGTGVEVRPSAVSLTDDLVRILVTDYAGRLDLAAPAPAESEGAPTQGQEPDASFLAMSSLTRSDDSVFSVTLKLVRASDSTILWADTRHLPAGQLAHWPALAAADLVQALERLASSAT